MFSGALVALFLARGVMTLCILPPLEGWDEYQHVAYIEYLIDHDATPVLGGPGVVVSRPLLAAVARLPQPEHMLEQTLGTGARGYQGYWEEAPDAQSTIERDAPVALYQAQHASLYYRLARPVYVWAGGRSNLPASIAALRALNLLFAAGALAGVLASLGALVSPRDARGLGILVALQPLFLQNAVRVANDSLAVLLASIVVAAALHPGVQRSLWLSLILGLTAAAAGIAKAFGMVLVPFLAISYFVSALTGKLAWRRAALCGGLALVSASSILVPSLLGNFADYGGLTGMQEGLVNRAAGRGVFELVEIALGMNWPRMLAHFWLYGSTWVGGWSFLSTGSTLRGVVMATLILMSAGWCWRWASPGARREMAFRIPGTALRLVALVALVSAALGYHAIESQAAWGVVTTNSWYAAFAFPWALSLAYVGALQWPGRMVGPILAGLLVVLYAGAEVDGAFLRMVPFYANTTGWLALERIASLRPELLGTSTLSIAGALAVVLFGTLVWLAIRDLVGSARVDE